VVATTVREEEWQKGGGWNIEEESRELINTWTI